MRIEDYSKFVLYTWCSDITSAECDMIMIYAMNIIRKNLIVLPMSPLLISCPCWIIRTSWQAVCLDNSFTWGQSVVFSGLKLLNLNSNSWSKGIIKIVFHNEALWSIVSYQEIKCIWRWYALNVELSLEFCVCVYLHIYIYTHLSICMLLNKLFYFYCKFMKCINYIILKISIYAI